MIFIFSLFIGLLYTKSCILAYEVCPLFQETSNLYYGKDFDNGSLSLSDGESFSEDEIYSVERRKKKKIITKNGLLYTDLSTS